MKRGVVASGSVRQYPLPGSDNFIGTVVGNCTPILETRTDSIHFCAKRHVVG